MVYLPPKHGLSFRGFARVKAVRLNLTAYWLEGTPHPIRVEPESHAKSQREGAALNPHLPTPQAHDHAILDCVPTK